MSTLYFLPGVPSVTRENVTDLGLSYAIDKFQGLGAIGPSGSRGQVVASDGEVSGYFPDQQTWIPAPQGDADHPPYWIGWANDRPPTPETLARNELLSGERITFRDGSVWQVPKLVSWHDSGDEQVPAVYSTPLPQMIDVDKYGNPTSGVVVKEYRDLFDLGLQVLAKLAVGNDSLSQAQLMHFAADVIGLNYRVSLFELSASVLDHLSTSDADKVIYTAIDWESYKGYLGNWAGRQVRPTTDTDSGSNQPTQEEPATTGQLSPN